MLNMIPLLVSTRVKTPYLCTVLADIVNIRRSEDMQLGTHCGLPACEDPHSYLSRCIAGGVALYMTHSQPHLCDVGAGSWFQGRRTQDIFRPILTPLSSNRIGYLSIRLDRYHNLPPRH